MFSKLLEVLLEADLGNLEQDFTFTVPTAKLPESNTPLTKPWLPFKECQFKCCHTCRPTLGERAYLSLNGIANGDIPATATIGFGFHLQKRRPVTSVDIIKTIGLRTPPAPVRFLP